MRFSTDTTVTSREFHGGPHMLVVHGCVLASFLRITSVVTTTYEALAEKK